MTLRRATKFEKRNGRPRNRLGERVEGGMVSTLNGLIGRQTHVIISRCINRSSRAVPRISSSIAHPICIVYVDWKGMVARG